MSWGIGNVGGSDLNFLIRKYNSEGELPKTAPNNTIAIITSEKITDWFFSPKMPETNKNGAVWISTGSTSSVSFNSLKNHGIYVFPIKAMQYQNGTWVEKTAKSFINGEWNPWWNGELYTPGNEWEVITGGWTAIAKKAASDSAPSPGVPTITRYSNMIVADNATNTKSGIFYCSNKIDLTKIQTITIEGNFTRAGAKTRNLMLGCWKNLDGKYYQTSATKYKGLSKATGTILQLDVSDLYGEYYVGIGLNDSKAEVVNAYMV